jgi:hypothetical protein
MQVAEGARPGGPKRGRTVDGEATDLLGPLLRVAHQQVATAASGVALARLR